MQVLLIEDNPDLGEAVARRLRSAGHGVVWNSDGDGVAALVDAGGFDAVILDLTLPRGDGIAILGDLRRRHRGLPVLVMTARSEIDDKVSLLDLGADDYLTKPFDMRELEARLRAVTRRPSGLASALLVLGDVALDLGAQVAMRDGQPLDLGPREFRLLEALAKQVDRVVPKERLMMQLFGYDDSGSVNALELLVSRLRRKLAQSRVDIVTVRGAGYMARVPHG